jgi:hypothetical protein
LLGDSTDLVREFYRRQFNAQGAAGDRGGKPDLYYTIFALAGAQALDAPIPTAATVRMGIPTAAAAVVVVMNVGEVRSGCEGDAVGRLGRALRQLELTKPLLGATDERIEPWRPRQLGGGGGTARKGSRRGRPGALSRVRA